MSELKPYAYPREAMWRTDKGRDEEFNREVTRLRSEVTELVEALRNVMGIVDTPIGRRKLGIRFGEPASIEARIVADARALLSKHKE